MLAHALNNGAPSISPSAVRRVAGPARGDSAPARPVLDLSGPALGSNEPTIVSLYGILFPRDQKGQIQAYCRRIINEIKWILAFRPVARSSLRHREKKSACPGPPAPLCVPRHGRTLLQSVLHYHDARKSCTRP